MTAARYAGNGTIVVGEDGTDPPGPGEVRLAVAYTGICGTDLHVLHGAMDHRVRVPQVIGHEMAGRIEAVGESVTGWAAGQPVTVMPLEWCGRCPACRAGHRHICHRLSFVGIDAPGSMQTTWNVPAHLLVALPEDLPLPHAALVEPTAVAVHDVRRAALVAGERVVVIGGGPVGVLVALVAGAAGADVLLVEINEHRRAVADRLGLTTLDPDRGDVAAHVQTWTAGAGAAAVFEVSGAEAAVTTAVDLLAVRGRLVVVAIHGQPRAVNLHRFFWRELTMLGARVYERADFERAVDLIHGRQIPVEALISAVIPIGDAPSAFRALAGGGAVMKVLVDCQDTRGPR
ncbi:MAG: alcohol dehydrogenase catalytic domain-containing protein [Dactylosporangium sp.]|nr:alcohol dehydrogenase catalytic domain-containing protein [Dactylosporangium sp.]NNJ61430.1 alcohol dehydrogenase catalytic domain-containing protein [Dactylosporangium sp.]